MMKLKTTRSFYNGLHQFGMEVPISWTTQNSALASTLVKFVHRESARKVAVLSVSIFKTGGLLTPQDPFASVVNVAAATPPPSNNTPLTAEDMFTLLKSEHPTASSLEAGTAKIKDFDAVWNIIEATEPEDSRIIGKFYHFRRDGQLWRFAASTDCGREFFDAMLPSMEQAIASASFDKPEI
jgi:hypothetical protein